MENTIDKKVDEILHSVDGINRIQVSPFLKTRILASISKEPQDSYVYPFTNVMLIAASIVLIFTNIYIAKNIVSVHNKHLYSNRQNVHESSTEYQLNSTNYEYVQ